ncbi:hypothetical protein BB561_000652 [Smittium simulii]|uniref:Reverse transcriptase RNase H-like domain-containing protein n=1 Tax=Smittium simulii TaxID=133385 RepID=A0A2T9YY79_9FUNG|nr:hypothetical protein BB561_000652 [Smittium simulii]
MTAFIATCPKKLECYATMPKNCMKLGCLKICFALLCKSNIVPKTDKTPRSYINFRLLNKDTILTNIYCRTLNCRNQYCTSDKKALAVIYGFNEFYHYVHGSCTKLFTDYCALIKALSNINPGEQIAIRTSVLQAYGFMIKHIKGLFNEFLDALSRDFAKKQ